MEPITEVAQTDQRVRRRRVFYIPGYDPFHPRRYRELYRKEGEAQAQISGYELGLKPKKTGGAYGWHVTTNIKEVVTDADVEVLVWSDIVKTSMSRGILATYAQLVRTAYAYIASGALFRLAGLRKGPMIAALYPFVFLLVQLFLAILAGWGVGMLVSAVHPVLGWAAGLGVLWAVLRAFKRWDNKVFAYYLMHDYAYSAQAGGANPPELEARMTAFRLSIRAALSAGFDEVLVVGHSSGAHLSVSILADLLREGLPQDTAKIGFLSLGQVVPMVSFLPKARRLRADLHYLAAQDRLVWVDVTAPGDGCAFALCDPVAVTGVAPEAKVWPLVISAAFTQTLSPARWKALRWKFFRLHFQYLCAFDRPGHYDYFQITAGPLSLADRYRDRAASKSRIERPASGYRDMA
ncbi:hypothetical protein GCM10010873_33050 [Cypionkella aquatica]|uniref:Uncharacterized protein n=1 Tax=Cypionkella aquatica TaxID=1756042 RepID=A0AA37UBA1_9RHOB|nr:hypothetical protein [Cypionkella aquatica]GLS88331.1 hypothetical protein GCM10010873_33050 [Cypionkella aquatica]